MKPPVKRVTKVSRARIGEAQPAHGPRLRAKTAEPSGGILQKCGGGGVCVVSTSKSLLECVPY